MTVGKAFHLSGPPHFPFVFFLIIANLYLICSLRAGYLGDDLAVAVSLSPQPLEVRTVIVSILQLGTWRLEEMP